MAGVGEWGPYRPSWGCFAGGWGQGQRILSRAIKVKGKPKAGGMDGKKKVR